MRMRTGIYKKCVLCQKEFYVKRCLVKKGFGKYCSRDCKHNDQGKYFIGKNNPRWVGGEVTKVCVLCKKEFKSYSASKQRFCNYRCGNLSRRNKPNYKKRNRKVVNCGACNKEFYLAVSQIMKSNYCSLECLHSIRLGKPNLANRGENNGQWRGGITPELMKIRGSLEYASWRRKVFQRDNFICIWCGIKGGWSKELKKQIILNADHIKPFAIYPELRFELSNGRTLCEDCHKTTPTFGILAKYQILM